MRRSFGINAAIEFNMTLKKPLIVLAVFGFHAGVNASMYTGESCTNSPSSLQGEVRSVQASVTSDSEEVEAGSVYRAFEAIASGGKGSINMPEECSRFVSGNQYGEWGSLIADEISDPKYAPLYRGTKDIRRLCPGFDSMSDSGKRGFWVLVMSTIAAVESHCGLNEKPHKAVKGHIAVGLYQLDDGLEDKYPPDNPGLCQKGDGRDDEKSIHCTIAIINDRVSVTGELFDTQSYWEPLRTNIPGRSTYKIVEKAIQNYPLCK